MTRKRNGLNPDILVAAFFMALTTTFIVLVMANQAFFDWVFERHHNQWSWYLRPIFLLPFCYFSYKKSWSGISITLFCLFTSMCWFNKPEVVPENVKEFLQMEKEWLYESWNYEKGLLIVTVPVSFFLLGLACWKRSLLIGIGVLVLMATGKVIWSIQNAGEAGMAVILPAVVGLLICSGLIFYSYKRRKRKK